MEQNNSNAGHYRDHLEKKIGSFFPRILHLENLMNDITSRHFSSGDENGVLSFYSLAPQMSFEKRIDIFMNTLRNHFNDIYRIYEKELKKLYEIDGYRKDLEQQMVSVSENVLNNQDDGIRCAGYKNRKSMGDIDYKEYERTIRLCSQVATILSIIQREIIVRAYHS